MLSDFVWFLIPIIFMAAALKAAEKSANELSNGMINGVLKSFRKAALFLAVPAARMLPGSTYVQGTARGLKNAWQNRTTGWLPMSDKEREKLVNNRAEELAGGLSNVGRGGYAEGAAAARSRAKERKIAEEKKRLKDSGAGKDTLLRSINSGKAGSASSIAAAELLNERDDLNVDDFTKAVGAVGNDMERATAIMKKMPKSAMEASASQLDTLMKTGLLNANDPSLDPVEQARRKKLVGELEGRMKGEGYGNNLATLKIKQESDKLAGMGRSMTNSEYNKIFDEVFGKMNSEKLASQKGLFSNTEYMKYAQRKVNGPDAATNAQNKKYYQDSMRWLSQEDRSRVQSSGLL